MQNSLSFLVLIKYEKHNISLSDDVLLGIICSHFSVARLSQDRHCLLLQEIGFQDIM